MKECRFCEITKELSAFSKHKSTKDGYQNKCKACVKAYNQANREKIAVRKKAYNQANREKVAARDKARYEANRETKLAKIKAWREANREKEIARKKAWAEANPDKINARNAKRRAAKLQRSPTWANLRDIETIYASAKRVEDCSGVPMHVDHIIPLRGELVSGLHVASNLQVIPASQNCSKSNNFDI